MQAAQGRNQHMVTFYVVRHGETEANRNGVLQGHLDVPLSSEGLRQARAAGRALAGVEFDAVYSSDLCRARETARAILEGRQCELVLDRRLREINLGSLSGLTGEEARERFPEYHARLAKDPYYTRRPGGGESRMDLRERVASALDDIYEWNKAKEGACVAIVSHGGVINAILNIAKAGVDWPGFTVDNCSVTVLERDDDGWRTVKMNDCRHLEGDVNLPRDVGDHG